MKISNIFKKNIFALTAAGVMSIAPLEASALVEGSWEFHPGYNIANPRSHGTNPNHTVRMMEGARYTYFLIQQRSFAVNPAGKNAYGSATIPSAVLYRADNSLSQSADAPALMEPVCKLPGAGGIVVQEAEYDLATGTLAVVYQTGVIDLISDNGEIVTINDFKSRKIPGVNNKVNAITFSKDGREIYFATTFGFFVVDREKGAVNDLVISPKSVGIVTRLGNHLLAGIDGQTLIAPLKEGLKDIEAFKPLAIDESASVYGAPSATADNIATPKFIACNNGILRQSSYNYVIDDNNFVAFIKNPSQNQYGIYVVNHSDSGSWRVLMANTPWFPSTGADFWYGRPFIGHMGEWQKGYRATTAATSYYWDGSVVPNFDHSNPYSDYMSRARKTITHETAKDEAGKNIVGYPYNYSQMMVSYDAENFWFYSVFSGWYRRHYDAKANTWSDLTALSHPDGPTVSLTDNFAYSSDHGMIIRQFGQSRTISTGVREPDNLMIRKNGEWKNYGLSESYPEVSTGLIDPKGIAVDPNNNKYFWSGSAVCGLVRRNFEDPKDVMFLGVDCENSNNNKLPGFVSAFPVQQTWLGYCSVDDPKFDVDGNLWFVYNDFDRARPLLGYWSASDIAASANAGKDASTYKPFSLFEVPEYGPFNPNKVLPAANEASRGYVVFDIGDQLSPTVFIAKTEGSGRDLKLADIKEFTNIVDEEGTPIRLAYHTALKADPNTGRVWGGFNEGIYWFNPKEIYEGTGNFHNVKFTTTGSADRPNAHPFKAVMIESLEFDSFGRVWVGTEGAGVYCLSSDGSEMLGHFTSANAPMESDNIYGLGWNRDTNSLFVSTEEGLFEFTPYEFATSADPSQIKIYPSAVTPDFNGYVSISGVPASVAVSLLDASGAEVCRMPASVSGTLQWDGRGADGKRVATGRYTFADNEGRKLGQIVIY